MTDRGAQLAPLARTLGAATGIGLGLGLVVGGVGGRLAMRLLFLTSGPGVQGLESDDGFLIGRFTAATFNLAVTGALLGVVGAFTYLAVRRFLLGPLWLRSLTCGAAAGAVIGSLLVNPDGVDFTRLGPVWLAVALFVAIPALFGLLCPPLMEAALRPRGWASSARGWLVMAPLAVFLFPPLLMLVAVPTAVVFIARGAITRSPRLQAIARHAVTWWAGRLAWAAVAVLGAIQLAQDALALR